MIGKRSKVDPIARLNLTRFLKARSFDVLQTWIFAANTYARVPAWMAGIPVVIVAEMAVDLWKGSVDRSVDRWLSTWCDRLVGNSHAVVEFYQQAWISAEKLAMIYSGAEDGQPPQTNPQTIRTVLGFEATAPIILFAGRLASQKRVDDLVKALDLPAVCSTGRAHRIAGDGCRCEIGSKRRRTLFISTIVCGSWAIAEDVPT